MIRPCSATRKPHLPSHRRCSSRNAEAADEIGCVCIKGPSFPCPARPASERGPSAMKSAAMARSQKKFALWADQSLRRFQNSCAASIERSIFQPKADWVW
jgi:hypothetical protein